MSKKLKESSDRVWLAGLGALAVAEQEGNDLFQQLVRKGRKIERALEQRESPYSILWENPVWSKTAVGHAQVALERHKRGRETSPLDKFLPTIEEKKKVEARQARRLAAARRAFLKEFGSLKKAAPDCERLQREHKIFVVIYRGTTYVPSFQFDESGNPLPAVARVIQILGKETSDWGLALWFTAASGSLGGKRPVDLLSSHPDKVVQAAEQEAAELVF